MVVGEYSSPVKVWRSEREDWESGDVYLDEFARVNIQAEVGTEVTFKTVETSEAERIILNCYRGIGIEFDSSAVDMIKKQWLKRPVSIGDVIPVLSDQHGAIPLVIGHIEPDGESVIRDDTEIRINGM